MIDDRLDRAGLLQQKLAGYRERGVSRVKLGLTDLDGVIRGKYVNLDKFTALMEQGGGFRDCVSGWYLDGALYDDARHTGWHTGFPDARYRLLTDTERWLADEGCPYFIGEFAGAEDFVEHFAMSRHRESREYERHVNSWQLERYFEIT